MPTNAPGAKALMPIVAATGSAFLLVQLDVSIINVALPAMGDALSAGITGLQWIVDAYALAFAALLLLAGTLGDRLGARKIFLSGFGLFIAASLACGAAPGLPPLIALRVLQGIGAALMVPSSLALLNRACGDDAAMRSRAVGLWTAAGSVGLALGPVLGGFLVGALGWRGIFLVNLPAGALGVWLTLRAVDETEGGRGGFDPAGQVLASLALIGLVGAAIEAGPRGWSSPLVISGIALAALAGAGFVAVEARGRDPMLPLGFFRKPAFSASVLVGFAVNLTLYGTIFVLSLYLQRERGDTPAQAGLTFLPFTVALGLANVAAGHLAGRLGTRPPMIAGLAVAGLGYGLLRGLGDPSAVVSISVALVVVALGIGTAVPAMTSALLATAPGSRGGVAAGVLNTVRQAAGALGVALFGTLAAVDVSGGVRTALAISVGLMAAAMLAAAFAGRPAKGPRQESLATTSTSRSSPLSTLNSRE